MPKPLAVLGLSLAMVGLAPAAALAQAEDANAQVDQIFAQWDRADSPGCALGVMRAGEIVYARGYGGANLDYELPLTAQSVFYIASTSKQFTAMSVLLLARQGKLSLDDDVRTYLPELPDYGQTITIRHLLHHTSGIRDYLSLSGMSDAPAENIHSDQDFVALIARQRALNFDPGEEFLYSNSNYFLLSQIVERASGQSLRQYAEENIFAPLGMTHTIFRDDRAMVIKNRVAGYVPAGPGAFTTAVTLFQAVGDGGLMTSVEDLAKWDANRYANQLGGGGPELIDEWLTPGVLNNGEAIEYSAGITVGTYRGLVTEAHSGGFIGFSTELLRFPDQQLSVVCLCNLANIDAAGLARKVADVYLADIVEPVEAAATAPVAETFAVSEQDLVRYVGLYFDPEEKDAVRVALLGGRLVVRGAGLIPVAAGRFQLEGAPITIEFPTPAADAAAEMVVTFPGDAARYQAVAPISSDDLNNFAGSYRSEELDATYTLVVTGDEPRLALERQGRTTPFDRPSRDVFSSPTGTIEFTRDGDSRVTGMTLNAGRVRGLAFTRVPDASASAAP